MPLSGWRPALGGRDRESARDVAREVVERLRRSGGVDAALARLRQQSGHKEAIHWKAHGVGQGNAGLALFYGAVDAVLPDEGWDAAAHEELAVAAASAGKSRHVGLGMFSGLAGLAFTAWFLSRDGARYRKLVASLDDALIPQVLSVAQRALCQPRHGVAVSTFDAISGLAGVGRYLLVRKELDAHRAALDCILRVVVSLAEERDGVPRWHTPSALISDENSRRLYPDGNLNLGLAHGIPGPLALLSLAAGRGVLVEGQLDTMRRMADWLCRCRIEDVWGVNWPSAAPLGPTGAPLHDRRGNEAAGRWAPTRAAWCYGAPGIARALWLAGDALADEGLKALAVSALEAVHRRPLTARHIDSPTFCHGVAGLQQITLRFAADTRLPIFADAASILHRQIIDQHEPDSLLGFRNLEPGGRRTDHPGLLDGAPGVAMVLLAASTSVEPRWDALFLLS